MDEIDLEEVIESARSGDEWAIACLFRAMQPQLLRYLTHYAPDAADDLASETWLSAARLLPDFEGASQDFRALLFTIAKRRVVDHYRRQGRRPKLAAFSDNISDRPDQHDVAQSAVEGLSANQAIELLTEILSPDQAEVVLLRVVADLSAEEVARVMGRSPGSVRVLQHRALQRLAKHFPRDDVTN
jgi:RNA polymerase sigma-70 factor (ECF subfamily)